MAGKKILSNWTDRSDLQLSQLALFSPVLSEQAGCQNDTNVTSCAETGISSDPLAMRKEGQFQEQSLSEESLLCLYLTKIYSELNRPSHQKCRLWCSVGEWMNQKENQICTDQYHPQTCDERQSGDWLHQKEAEDTKWKELVPGQSPGGPHKPRGKERILLYS